MKLMGNACFLGLFLERVINFVVIILSALYLVLETIERFLLFSFVLALKSDAGIFRNYCLSLSVIDIFKAISIIIINNKK